MKTIDKVVFEKCKGCDVNPADSIWNKRYCNFCDKRCKCGFSIGTILEYKKDFKIGGEKSIMEELKIYQNNKRNIYAAKNFLIMIKDHIEEWEEIADKYLMLM